MKLFSVIDKLGRIVAMFREHGDAIHYCHFHGIPVQSILETEVMVRDRVGR